MPAPSPLHAALAVRALAAPARDLLGAFEQLRGDACPWLLDSALADGGLGRWSFCGSDPWLVLRMRDGHVVVEPRREVGYDATRALRRGLRGRPTPRRVGDPLAALRALLGPTPASVADAPPFAGGVVAVLGHELAAETEPGVTFPGDDDLGLPDLAVLAVDRVLALDHASGRVVATGLGYGTTAGAASARAAAAAEALAARVAPALAAAATAAPGPALDDPAGAATALAAAPLDARFDASSYGKLVAAAKERIAAGDVYQVCLTHRLAARFAGDPWRLYRALRHASPAPFASYLALPEATLVGASPERFLRVEPDGRVETRPMKGTRPRGATPEDDAALADALMASAKDRAENVMIVDLARNDLGRVCATGTVHVPELLVRERYATVHTLVSAVAGRLAPGRDAVDAIAAAFPPGSMTGAPKRAALRILGRLEPLRRGPYGGALGWLDVRGGAELAVTIRSAVVKDGRATWGAGGGVVADSDPGAEWQESLDKALAFARALAVAGADQGEGGASR